MPPARAQVPPQDPCEHLLWPPCLSCCCSRAWCSECRPQRLGAGQRSLEQVPGTRWGPSRQGLHPSALDASRTPALCLGGSVALWVARRGQCPRPSSRAASPARVLPWWGAQLSGATVGASLPAAHVLGCVHDQVWALPSPPCSLSRSAGSWGHPVHPSQVASAGAMWRGCGQPLVWFPG